MFLGFKKMPKTRKSKVSKPRDQPPIFDYFAPVAVESTKELEQVFKFFMC
jgi:hypothetical protein